MVDMMLFMFFFKECMYGVVVGLVLFKVFDLLSVWWLVLKLRLCWIRQGYGPDVWTLMPCFAVDLLCCRFHVLFALNDLSRWFGLADEGSNQGVRHGYHILSSEWPCASLTSLSCSNSLLCFVSLSSKRDAIGWWFSCLAVLFPFSQICLFNWLCWFEVWILVFLQCLTEISSWLVGFLFYLLVYH